MINYAYMYKFKHQNPPSLIESVEVEFYAYLFIYTKCRSRVHRSILANFRNSPSLKVEVNW